MPINLGPPTPTVDRESSAWDKHHDRRLCPRCAAGQSLQNSSRHISALPPDVLAYRRVLKGASRFQRGAETSRYVVVVVYVETRARRP